MLSCAEYANLMLLQAHGPFIYVHWFGTVPSMQRQGYGGQVMKAVSHSSSHPVLTAIWGFQYMAMYTITVTYNALHTQTRIYS